MFRNLLNRRVGTQQDRNVKKRVRQARRGTFHSQFARLTTERLEDRIVLATLVWTGDVDDMWNSGTDGVDTNWDTNMLPQPGDTLVFPDGASNQTNTNDTPAGTTYSLEFTGGAYTISGNQITLDNGGTDILRNGGGVQVLGTPLVLDASSTIEVSPALGFLQFNSPLTGVNLIKTGPGDLLLTNASTYTGTTDVQGGRLQVELGGSITSTGTATIQAGGLIGTASTGSINAPVSGQAGSSIETFFAGNALSLGDGGSPSGFVTGGTLTVVDNSSITLLDADAAELGSDTLLGGTGATLNAANGVALGSGDMLRGTGTINGAVAINDGMLSPGNAGIGTINSGSLSFGAGGTYEVELNGATAGNFDQVNVLGTIVLGNATLSLSGPYVATASDPPIAILTETVGMSGTFAGLPEGSTILFNNAPLTISYCVAIANEVTLSYDTTPVIDGTTGADDFAVSLVGGNVEVRRGGSLIMSTALGDLTSLTINGDDGNDTLTVDYSGGDPIPAGGLVFNGEGQTGTPGDQIVVTGGNWTDTVYTFLNANDGSIDLDGSVITYTGLEPLTNTGTAANVIFNLPDGGNPDVVLQNSANAGETELVGSTFENTVFTNPTASLTINGGAGADAVSIQGVDAAFDADLFVFTFDAADTTTFETVATNIGTGQLVVNSGTIGVNANVTANGGANLIAANGNLTFGGGTLNVGAGTATLTAAAGAVDGNDDGVADVIGAIVDVQANAGGIGTGAGMDLEVTATTSFSADTTADNGNIDVDSIGDLVVGLVDAGSGIVTLDSTGAIDGLTQDGTADVIGSTINLVAGAGGIGVVTPLEVTATTAVNADTTADNASLLLDSIGNLPVGLIDAGLGAIDIVSTGSILDAGVDPNFNATSLVLFANGGIGSGDALESEVSVVDLTNTTSGNIELDNNAVSAGALVIDRLLNGGGTGDIIVTNVGDTAMGQGITIQVDGVIAVSGSVNILSNSPLTVAADVMAAGDIALTASDSAVAGDDLTVNAGVTVSSTGGNVALNAGDNLLLNPTALVSATAGGISIAVDNPAGMDADPGVGSIVTLSDSMNLVTLVGTNIASGSDNDVFNIVPQVASDVVVDGGAPSFGNPGVPPTVPPGDTLNLDVAALSATLDLIPTDGGFVGTLSSAADDVSFINIETITSVNGMVDVQVRLDLSNDAVLTNAPFNLPTGSGFGDDGTPDEVTVQVTADGLQLRVSDGVNTAEILPLAASVDSLTVVGSGDADSLILNETMLGLPSFPGQSPAAQTNPAFNASGIQPAAGNIGLAFVGGGGVDDLVATFVTSQNVAYFSHDGSTSIPGGAAPNAGVVSILGQLTMSFEGLAPMALFGAGGSLLMDATATPATTTLSIDDDAFAPGPLAVPAAPGNGVSAVYGDGGWETVQFTGFADVTVRGGSGPELIDLIAIDNTMAPGNLITDIVLDGDDTFNTDANDDVLRVQTLPAGVTATLMGGQDTGGTGDLYQLDNLIARPRGGEMIGPAPARSLDDVLGAVVIQPNASPSAAFPAPEEGGIESMQVTDFGSLTGDIVQVTGTTIDGITGLPPVPPTAISYNTNTVGTNLVNGVDVIENVAITSSDNAVDTFNILSSQLGSTYTIDTGVAGAFDDVVNISSTAPSLAGNLNAIDGQLNINFPNSPGTMLNVSDFGDTAGDVYDLIENGIATELYFNDGNAVVGNAGLLGTPDVIYFSLSNFQLIGSNDLAANNQYNIYDTTAAVSTTISDGDATNPGAGNNADFYIQADAVQPGSANVFSGFDGNDEFEVYFDSDVAIPGAMGTTFQINGGELNNDSENRDEVELNVGAFINSPGAGMAPTVNANPDTGARTLNFTYANPSGNDVDINGLGTDPGAPNNGVLDINSTETLFYNGSGPADSVQVTGTTSDDDLTVGLLNNNSSALVFRDGNPYIEAPPESIAGFLPGIAGGGFGPDMRINGIDANGIVLDGGGNDGNPGTGDRAIVQAASEMNVVTGGALDIFGFGAGILIPGFGGGNAYDTIDFNNTTPNQVSVVNNSAGPLLPVTIIPATFVQNGMPAFDQRPAFIVNGGDEAMAQANGISDNFTAAPSMLFNLQANGNLPGLVLGPDGLPIGDQLNLTSPTSINVFSDKSTPPNVTVTFGTNIFGVRDSGIERQLLTPGNGQLNLLGDNGNMPGTDQTDNFVVVGRDIDGDGNGVEQGTLEINGSTPRLFQMVDDLNVFGYELADTLEIWAYADDTPRGWGIDVFFDEGEPRQGDGPQVDLLIVHTSFYGGEVSEDIVIRPSGADNGEVVITNGSFGTPIVDIDFVNNTDIIVLDDDGFLNDTDTLTLLGTNPDNPGTSGNEFFEADFTAAGGVGSPQVTVTDLDPVSPGAAILYRLRDFQGFSTINIESLAGDDVVAVRNRPGLTVNADLGLPVASDTLHVAVPMDVTVTPGADPYSGAIEQATAGPINYVGAEGVTVDTDSPMGVLTVRGTNGNDDIALQGVGTSTGLQNQGTVSLNGGSVVSFNNAISLTSSLTGDQEVPPSGSLNFGAATFTYDPTTGLFDMDVFLEGLTAADVVGFHIHQAPFGVNGPVVVGFINPNTTGLAPAFVDEGTGTRMVLNDVPLPPAVLADFLAGNTYLNVHTPAVPSGEIRGQITGVTSSGTFTNIVIEGGLGDDQFQAFQPVDGWAVTDVTLVGDVGIDHLGVIGSSADDMIVYDAPNSNIAATTNGMTTNYGFSGIEAATCDGGGAVMGDTLTVLAPIATFTPGANSGEGTIEPTDGMGVARTPISFANIDNVTAMGAGNITILGTPENDFILLDSTGLLTIFSPTGTTSINLVGYVNAFIDAGGGDDTIEIAGDHPLTGSISVAGGDNGTATDTLVFSGSGGDVTVDLNASSIVEMGGGGPVVFSGVERVAVDAFGAALSVDGTSLDDVIDVTPLGATNDGLFTHNFTPSVSFQYGNAMPISFAGGSGGFDLLNVLGDAADNMVTSTATTVTVDGSTVTLGAGLDYLGIHTFAGDDNVDLDGLTIDATVDAGSGDDTVDASGVADDNVQLLLLGGEGDDNLIGGDSPNGSALGDRLEGGPGNDRLEGGRGQDFFFGGDGNDQLVWVAGDGSDLMEGGAGDSDVMLFDALGGANRLELLGGGLFGATGNPAPQVFGPGTLQNGSRSIFVLNSAGQDMAAVFLNMGDVEDIFVLAEAGADQISINNQSNTTASSGAAIQQGTDLALTSVRSIELDLGAGDGAADAVEVYGRLTDDVITVSNQAGEVDVAGFDYGIRVANAVAANDQLFVHGENGNDTIAAEDGVETLVLLTLAGKDGDDTLIGTPGDDTIVGNDGDDQIDGRGGMNTIDGGAGTDSILVRGSAADDVITTTHGAGTFNITGGLSAGMNMIANMEAVHVDAGAGSDTITLNLLAAGGLDYTVLGGNPIGAVGDTLNVVAPAAVTLTPGPETDEGSIDVATGTPTNISYDEIEALGITSMPGGGTLNIVATNADDDITIIGTGPEAFTVSINGGPAVQYTGFSTANIDSLAGDDDITLDVDVPMLGVTFNIEGNLPTGGSDQLRITGVAGFDDMPNWTPSGVDSGMLQLAGQAPINVMGIEQLLYDGESDDETLTVTGTANEDSFEHVPGALGDSGRVNLVGHVNPVDPVMTLLGLSYENLGFDGQVMIDGVGSNDFLTVLGTEGADDVSIEFPADGEIVFGLEDDSFVHVLVTSVDVEEFYVNTRGSEDTISLTAPVLADRLSVTGGDPGTGDVLTVLTELGANESVTLSPSNNDSDIQIIGGIGTTDVDIFGLEFIEFLGNGGETDTLTVDLGDGDNTARVEAGTIGDRFTSDAYHGIVVEFTAFDAFTVNGGPGGDVATFATRDLTGATAANYAFEGDGSDTLIIEGVDGDEDDYTVTRPMANPVAVTDNVSGVTVTAEGITQGRLQIDTLGGDDVVTVDETGGLIDPLITYNGGSGSDTLIVTGTTTVMEATYSPGPEVGKGRLTYDSMTIDFTGLEPVLDNVPAATVTINGTNADNAINYTAGPGGGIFVGATGLVSVDNFETYEFNNKDNLVINALAGDDVVNLNNPTGFTSAGGMQSITVNGGDPTASDLVIVNGTTGLDTISFTPSTTAPDSAVLTGVQNVPMVTVNTTEQLTINGLGGDDRLNVIADDTDEVEFTPDVFEDAGAFAISSDIVGPIQRRLPMDFLNLGAGGFISVNSASGMRDVLLRVNGTPDDDIITVGTNDVVQIFKRTTNFFVTLPIRTPGVQFLALDGANGNDDFNIPLNHPYTFSPGIQIEGGNPGSGSDTLFVTGSGANQVTVDLGAGRVTEATFTPVAYTGIETIQLDTGGAAPTVRATGVDDDLTVTVYDANSGSVQHGFAVQQDGQVATNVAPPLVNYTNIGGNAINFDLAGGQDTLVVVGSSFTGTGGTFDQRFDVDVPMSTVSIDDDDDGTNQGLVTYTNNESLAVFGLEGDDVFRVTPGAIPVFIDGGDPIGSTPGDQIDIVAGGQAVVFEPGPQNDEGGFLVGSQERVSFDHIEGLGVFMAAKAIITGTNDDDEITIIARTERAAPPDFIGADGVQDFTVSVNNAPDILWLDTPLIFVDGLNGDDDITIRTPAPNNADWDVDVFVAGGAPSQPVVGDRLRVETPLRDDTIQYQPTGPDSGIMSIFNAAGAAIDSVIYIGQWAVDCDDDGVIDFISSPGGVEQLLYDGVSAEGSFDHNVITGVTTQNPAVASNDNLTILGDGFAQAASNDAFVHTPGSGPDAGTVAMVDRTNGQTMLGITYTNIGLSGIVTIDGQAGTDSLTYDGTAFSDTFNVPFTGGATDTSIGLNQQVEVDTLNVESYTLRAAGGDDYFGIRPPSSRNIAITLQGDEPGGSDLLDFFVNGATAAPRSIQFSYDDLTLTPDPSLQTIRQDALGTVTLLGIETTNLIGNANADVENATISGTRFSDTTTYTPLGTHQGTISNDREENVVTIHNFDQGEDAFTITGGGGFADRVVVNGTNGRDLIQVNSTTRTVTPIVLPFAFPSGPGTANPGTTWRDVVLDGSNASPAASLVDTLTVNGNDGDDTFHVVPGVTANGATLFINVDGGQPQASDALVITNLNANGTAATLAATDFVVIGHSRIPDAGNIITYQSAVRRPSTAYTNVEVVSANLPTGGLNPNLLILGPDHYEQNEFQGTAAYLGSGDTINVQDLAIFPDANEHPGVPADNDFFQVVAETTGTLDFQVFFRVFDPGLLPGGGQLGINVLDKAGNVIGGAGTFGNPDGTADARVRIPAVEGQEYFLRVFGANADGTVNTSVVNGYDMTIVNHAPPVPFDLELYDLPIGVGTNPPGGTANSDTGRSRFDNITFDTTPTIAFRLDDAIFLQDLPGNPTPDSPPDEVIPIPFRAGPNQPTAAGYAIAIFDEGATNPPSPGNAGGNQVQQPLGFATMVEPGLYTFTTPVLNNGSHFLTARVQMLDPANPMQTGFGDRSLSLEIIVDTVAPTITFGSAAVATDGLHPDSDSHDWNPQAPGTRTDRITNDVTPTFWGVAEADSYIRVYVDQNNNGVVDGNDVQIANTTAIPLDGGDQFPNGYWEATSFVDLNNPSFFAFDGQRNILVTAEDVAGNVSAAQQLSIFIDTQGPQVTGNPFISDGTGNPVDPGFNLFALKPDNANQGPTPLVEYLTIPVRDLPARTAAFIYQAVSTGPPVGVGVPGNLPLEAVVLEGDANGVIPIESIVFIPTTNGPGIATGNIVIEFLEPLPDDRYTLRLNDENIIDPAGNQLDGENDSAEPGAPTYPTGDGRPGGDFIARFTVDSRPEIGVWASGTVWVDINGNGHYDPENLDFTNRDFVYSFGNGSTTAASGGIAFTSDDFIAGDFNGNGFDELAAYGSIGTGISGPWRWLVDTTDDGRPDMQVTDPQNVNGLPVAGNFDAAQNARDEVGLFTGTNGNRWWFDTNGDYQVDTSVVTTALRGYPIVGDFDGDGFDDLGAYENGVFRFLLTDGTARSWLTGSAVFAQVLFDSVSGVRERPIAADMDQDGIDDIGLWMPDRAGQTPEEGAEWFWLISADPDGTNRIDGQINTLAHAFSPVPLGNDLYYQFGDAYAIPIVGNFDPPTGIEGEDDTPQVPVRDPLDVNFDGAITSLDALAVINSLNTIGPHEVGDPLPGQIVILDANRDGFVTSADARVIINYLNLVSGEGEGEGEGGLLGAFGVAETQPLLTLPVTPAPVGTVATASNTSPAAGTIDALVEEEDDEAWLTALAATDGEEASLSGDPARDELFAAVGVEDELLEDLAADITARSSRSGGNSENDLG